MADRPTVQKSKYGKPPDIVVPVPKQAIETAVRNHAGKCIVAQALRFMGSDIERVNVTSESAVFVCQTTKYIYLLPSHVAVKIVNFDKGKKIKPFSFKLRGEQGFCRVFEREDRHKLYNARPGKRLIKEKSRKTITGRRSCVRRFCGLKVITVSK